MMKVLLSRIHASFIIFLSLKILHYLEDPFFSVKLIMQYILILQYFVMCNVFYIFCKQSM